MSVQDHSIMLLYKLEEDFRGDLICLMKNDLQY